MFINFELWDEELRDDSGQPVRFGSSLDAHLDMHQLKVRHRPVNVNGILSFEPTRIWTNGRPGTNENKSDVLEGVRLLLVDGSQYVVINDKDPTFLAAMALAREASEAVYEHGPSAYMQQFANDPASVR